MILLKNIQSNPRGNHNISAMYKQLELPTAVVVQLQRGGGRNITTTPEGDTPEVVLELESLSQRLDAALDLDPLITSSYTTPPLPLPQATPPSTNTAVSRLRSSLTNQISSANISLRPTCGNFFYKINSYLPNVDKIREIKWGVILNQPSRPNFRPVASLANLL